jgi:hypothetical protein
LPADGRCPDGVGLVVGVLDALDLVGEPGVRVGLGECDGECDGECVGE